jgi:heat shock protein HslJ
MTRMACLAPDANRQEQQFTTVLGAATHWAIANDALVLIQNGKTIARFIASGGTR